jgi:hypothetical protein
MCERANPRHAFRWREIEFNPLSLVGARPGLEFAFQQPPINPYQELTCPRCPSLCEGSERIDDSNGAGWEVRVPSVLAELTSAGKRELEKIKVAERWGGDHDAGSILHRIDGDRAQLCLSVSKIEVAFLRQIGQPDLDQHPAQILPRVFQITSAEDWMARQQISVADRAGTTRMCLKSGVRRMHGQSPNRATNYEQQFPLSTT